MPRSRTSLVSAGMLLAALWMSGARAADIGETPDTARLLDRIEEERSALTPADRQAARRLDAEGDRAYRRKDYRAAFTAYANSYPNAPTAYAYIMAGDAHWRAVVQQARKTSTRAPGTASCRLNNSHFAHDLATDLAQHQALGLTLAARDNDRRFLASKLYHRARESAACLHSLAQRYEAEPAASCVDMQRLERCLGAPLIKGSPRLSGPSSRQRNRLRRTGARLSSEARDESARGWQLLFIVDGDAELLERSIASRALSTSSPQRPIRGNFRQLPPIAEFRGAAASAAF